MFDVKKCTFSLTASVFLTGSDSWTAEEKCYFNKGISAYRKDFFLVQKLVSLWISILQPMVDLCINKQLP